MTTDYYSDELIESNEQENDFSYAFDPTLIEQQGHSLVVILEAKLCPNGQQKLKSSDPPPHTPHYPYYPLPPPHPKNN